MEITVTPKKWYVVSGAAGSTISTPEGVVIATVPDGGQASFYATTYTVEASDDSTEVVEATFKYAPAKLKALGVFGRGETLPSGYLPALFLESTGTQRIVLNDIASNNTGAILRATSMSYNDTPPAGINANGMRWYLPAPALQDVIRWGWKNNNDLDITTELEHCYSVTYNWKNNKKVILDGSQVGSLNDILFTASTIAVFAYKWGSNYSYDEVRIFSLALSEEDNVVRDFMPALNAQGIPCLFDKISKQTFYNSGKGAFIVGMTVAQARKLGKLPADATTKTLTISLPQSAFVDVETGEIADAAVNAALAQAEANGWVITKQYYTES